MTTKLKKEISTLIQVIIGYIFIYTCIYFIYNSIADNQLIGCNLYDKIICEAQKTMILRDGKLFEMFVIVAGIFFTVIQLFKILITYMFDNK